MPNVEYCRVEYGEISSIIEVCMNTPYEYSIKSPSQILSSPVSGLHSNRT